MNKEIPEFLSNMLSEQYGEELTNKILEGYTKKRPVTLRVNTLKASVDYIKNKLKETGVCFKEASWNKEAIVIQNVREDEIRKLDIYQRGEIYLQSLSSMIPPILLGAKEGDSILDMAAAPGGKTTQIAAITDNKASITACELNKIRAEKLKYNLEKQGVSSVYVMITDSRRLDDCFSFDKILLDAPCSGSGIIYLENVDFEKGFTEQLISKSISSQKKLLKKALKVLKPGCEMIYSTCSILKSENEEVVKEILNRENAEIVPIDTSLFKGLPLLPVGLDGTICICPNELYEGFFVVKIKKLKIN